MAVAFARVLRGAGLGRAGRAPCSPSPRRSASSALDDRDDVYWAARATLVRRPEDIDAVRPGVRRVLGATPAPAATPSRARADARSRSPSTTTTSDDDDAGRRREPSDDPTIELRFSAAEVLRHKDFAAYDDDELRRGPAADGAAARRRLAAPVAAAARRRTRRTPRPDLRAHGAGRAAHRAASRSRRHYREPATRHRRLVLLLDVSGSMEPYARALLRFVQAAVAGRRRVEAFALGTRLTRITRELGVRDPDVALRQAAERVVDWRGGTRLGDGLRTFNDEWGVRGMARGADRRDPVRRVGPRRPGRARRADAAPAARHPPHDLGQPAEGHARATRRWPGAWRPPCRTLTASSRATRWTRWSVSADDPGRTMTTTRQAEHDA